MDIGKILKGVGIAKDFLGGDSNTTQSGPSALDIHNVRGGRFDAYKVGTDTYGNRVTTELAPPGQAAQIQQISYKDTQRFWDNYLTEYMRG